jgi:hypothetical protein
MPVRESPTDDSLYDQNSTVYGFNEPVYGTSV